MTLGGSTNFSSCNAPLTAMGMSRLNSLAAVTARTRLDNTTAADQRYAQQITAGHRPLGNGLSALQVLTRSCP